TWWRGLLFVGVLAALLLALFLALPFGGSAPPSPPPAGGQPWSGLLARGSLILLACLVIGVGVQWVSRRIRGDISAHAQARAPARGGGPAGPPRPAPAAEKKSHVQTILSARPAAKPDRATIHLKHSGLISRADGPIAEELILHKDYERLWSRIARAQGERVLL